MRLIEEGDRNLSMTTVSAERVPENKGNAALMILVCKSD